MNILLLEDDIILNEIIEEFLLSLNHNVTSLFDGEEALELIYDNKYDLLLLDVNVPNITGFELLKSIKENEINIPTIFITSLNTNDDMKKGFKIGCDDYLKKPFDLSELELRINNVKRLCKINSYGIDVINNEISYDSQKKIIKNKNELYKLSKTESKILEYLIKNRNRTVSISEISINNWIYDEMQVKLLLEPTLRILESFWVKLAL